jgi:hypothetical protein
MSHVTLSAPAPVAMPRGAAWAAAAYMNVAAAVRAAWRAIAAERRQQRLLREAAALRRLAADLSASNPSMAADLYAAADRHVACSGL